MTKHFISLIFISLLAISCGTKKWGTPTGIEVRYSRDAHINYGKSFKVQTYLKFDSGKEKEITGKSELELSSADANVSGSYLELSSYPTSFQEDTVHVLATYIKKELNFTTKKSIPYNYKGDLVLEFSGNQGANGTNGSNGSTPLLFKDGKDGGDGSPGDMGDIGHDISVHIYKKEEDNLYYLRVTDLNASAVYYFKNKDVGFPIKVYSKGGTGGAGGTGGDGGDGKDGKKTEKKDKDPGSGGSGGIGGDGGQGGNGGNVYVFIHPSAKEIKSRITAFLYGGDGGEAGVGGRGGKPGTPEEGQTAGTPGNDGANGNQGLQGIPGPPIQMSVEDFDIDF